MAATAAAATSAPASAATPATGAAIAPKGQRSEAERSKRSKTSEEAPVKPHGAHVSMLTLRPPHTMSQLTQSLALVLRPYAQAAGALAPRPKVILGAIAFRFILRNIVSLQAKATRLEGSDRKTHATRYSSASWPNRPQPPSPLFFLLLPLRSTNCPRHITATAPKSMASAEAAPAQEPLPSGTGPWSPPLAAPPLQPEPAA